MFFAQITVKGKRARDKSQGRPKRRESLRPRYSAGGDLLYEAEYEKHLSEALPNADDERVLNEVFKVRDRVLRMNRRSASPTPFASKENP